MPALDKRNRPGTLFQQPNIITPATSEDPEDAKLATTYNARTGRPIRRSAGRKSGSDGFTSTLDAVSDDDSLEEEDPDEPRPRPKRRKRTPSPPMSLRELTDDEMSIDNDAHTDRQEEPHSALPPISLTFNVPRGHSGPFVVNIDLNSLVRQSLQPHAGHSRTQVRTKISTMRDAPEKSSSSDGRVGFLSLPPELRNQIYRMVFVDENRLDFGDPKNLSHTAALLRTCRQIHSEGCGFLYSENKFYWRRHSVQRTPLWSNKGSEVGFRDIHRLLKSIGPANIALLRNIVWLFEDAIPSLNPQFTTAEERRFVQDDYLMSSLKLVARHGRLRKLELTPFGRRNVADSDFRFVAHLKDIKADAIEFVNHPQYPTYASHGDPKILLHVKTDLVKTMTRKHRLYAGEVPKKKLKAKSVKPVCKYCGEHHD